ncbi:hypothetical protein ACFSC6_20315 [Rufibacter sediminis]|uniref:PglD N-terminal domain-containing protein n=1 Tax=Rufibacter sediminis TaxID=2762756 RepID=A0ABR6VNS8_9BACT|nr:hypothetical protein [Rufibacter sediminis]MBC3538795.1 hypothetical protein [Rufibacter sediminis]
MKNVLILGGQGNASVIGHAMLDANRRGDQEYQFSGYINDRDGCTEIEGYPVKGGLHDIPRLLDEGYYFLNTIYKIDGQRERIQLFDSLAIPPDRLATFVHPTAYIGANVELGPGSVVMPHAIVSTSVKLGTCARVMIGAIISHNCDIGAHTFIAAGSCSGSNLKVGIGVHISMNCTVREFVSIGDYSTLAMGSVLLKDMGTSEIWAGNPAKLLRNAQ